MLFVCPILAFGTKAWNGVIKSEFGAHARVPIIFGHPRPLHYAASATFSPHKSRALALARMHECVLKQSIVIQEWAAAEIKEACRHFELQ